MTPHASARSNLAVLIHGGTHLACAVVPKVVTGIIGFVRLLGVLQLWLLTAMLDA